MDDDKKVHDMRHIDVDEIWWIISHKVYLANDFENGSYHPNEVTVNEVGLNLK